MPFSRASLVGRLFVLLVGGLLFVTACDLPTGAPSFETKTTLSAPVVMDKTFSFLGGPKSEHEPLIDTTTSTFDSLFTVGAEPEQSLFISERIRSFDVGSLEGAIEEATRGVGVHRSLSEPVLRSTALATQSVEARECKSIGTLESGPVSLDAPIGPPNNPEDTLQISFPTDRIQSPESETFSAEGATFGSAQLTQETTQGGTDVNQVTYTLRNGDRGSTTLTDGDGNAPLIRLETGGGTRIAEKRFERPVAPGTSEDVTLSVAGAAIGEGTVAILKVVGGDPRDDTLAVQTTRFRYQEVTFEGVDQATFEPDVTTVSTLGSDAVRFAGITVRSGTLHLTVRNNLSFPIALETVRLTNSDERLKPLPTGFPKLDISETTGTIQPGGKTELTVDLAGRGIAEVVDVSVTGSSQASGTQLTVVSGNSVELSAGGSVAVNDLYFWPEGEQVHTGGAFDLDTDRLQFKQSNAFVELAAGTLALNNLVSEPDLAFERFTVSFPGLRQPPYAPGDSLVLRFVENPTGTYEFSPIGVSDPPRDVQVGLSDLRLSPTGNQVEYHLKARLETISNPSSANLRHVQVGDEISTDVSVGDLEVRALTASVRPFSVPVTSDVDGNGRLELGDDAEASVVSFEGFGGLAGQLTGLQLEGSRLTFSVTTDAGTNARLYAALQGRQGNTRAFLAGRGARAVAPTDSLGDDFYLEGSRIAAQNLIQFGLRGAPTDEAVTRSVILTDANSSVDDFISTLPTSLRFVGQALLTGDANGQIRLRRPLTFKAGLDVRVPVRFEGAFTVRDTVKADLSSLNDLIDPKKTVTISTATATLSYTNRVPLGARVEMTVLGADGNELLQLPGDGKAFRVKPAPKAEDGTTANPRSGTVPVDLTEQELRTLAKGKHLFLRLTVDQQQQGPAATVRATDTIQLSLRAKVKATVNTGE